MTDVFWIVVGSALFFGTFGYMGWQGWKAEQAARKRREWERHMVYLRQAVKVFPQLQIAMTGFASAAIKAAAEFDKLRFLIEHNVGLSLRERTRLRNLIDPGV